MNRGTHGTRSAMIRINREFYGERWEFIDTNRGIHWERRETLGKYGNPWSQAESYRYHCLVRVHGLPSTLSRIPRLLMDPSVYTYEFPSFPTFPHLFQWVPWYVGIVLRDVISTSSQTVLRFSFTNRFPTVSETVGNQPVLSLRQVLILKMRTNASRKKKTLFYPIFSFHSLSVEQGYYDLSKEPWSQKPIGFKDDRHVQLLSNHPEKIGCSANFIHERWGYKENHLTLILRI